MKYKVDFFTTVEVCQDLLTRPKVREIFWNFGTGKRYFWRGTE